MPKHVRSLSAPGLARVLEILRRNAHRRTTTLELARETGHVAVASDISDLRAAGIPVTRRFERVTPSGARIHSYRLASAETGEGA